MAACVTFICPHEEVWHDPVRISRLYTELGSQRVQSLLMRAMLELDALRFELEARYRAHDLEGFSRHLRSLRRIADHLGLISLRQIADDVQACVASGDATALGATWARLSRSTRAALERNFEQAR